MLRKIQPHKVRAPGGSFAIVASRYNARYVDAMLRAAKAELWRAEAASITAADIFFSRRKRSVFMRISLLG